MARKKPAPRFKLAALVTVKDLHDAIGSRAVSFDLKSEHPVGANGVVMMGGSSLGPLTAPSPERSFPAVPLRYVGRTSGSGEYTLRARVGGKTINSTSGEAPDFFTLEF